MHDSGALTWREVMERHHSALVDELSERLDSELRDAVSIAVSAERSKASGQLAQACSDARRSQVESLNQVLRRLRTAGEGRVLVLAAEGGAPYAEQLVVLVFENSQARCAASHGLKAGGLESDFSFEISSAPAIVTAIESRDPVVSLGTDAEISPTLANAFNGTFQTGTERKAYLFPVIARQSVVAMLIASGVSMSAPIELLCEAAGMRLEASPSRSGRLGSQTPRNWSSLK